MKLPIGLDFLYARHNLPQPEPGEALYVPPAVPAAATFDAPKNTDPESPELNAS